MGRYCPSAAKICKSFRLRGREFLRENTLHGFPYFVDRRRPLWERIMWFVCTAASIGSALGIIFILLQKFNTEPTFTGLDTQTEEMLLEFPSLTLCKMDQTFDLGTHQAHAAHFESVYYWSWSPIADPTVDLGGETYNELFYRTTPNCGDLYENCTYSQISKPCDEIFRKVVMPRGICCVSNGTIISKLSKPWELTFDSTAWPLSLDILEQRSLPARREAPHEYILNDDTLIETSIRYTYSTESVASLPKKQRQCLLPEEGLSYNACFDKCQKKKMLDVCKCLPWFLSGPGERNECSISGYDCLTGNKSILAKPDCNCYLSCNHATYEYLKIQDGTENRVTISILLWPGVIYKREVRFGWLDLLVSFGGIAGLFVGYSLLTTVELGYYLTLRAYCGAVIGGGDKIIKVKTPKPRTIKVIDLKRNYYDYVD